MVEDEREMNVQCHRGNRPDEGAFQRGKHTRLGSVKLYIHLCSTLNVPLLLELSECSVFSVCISAFQRKKEKNSC